MSALVFPSLPGLKVDLSRAENYSTKVFTTVSGKEQRIKWTSTPRYSWELNFELLRSTVMAPAPYAAMSEVACLHYFLDQHYGSWDSFIFNDPYSGTQVRVRFVEDTLTVKKLDSQRWSANIKIIQVL